MRKIILVLFALSVFATSVSSGESPAKKTGATNAASGDSSKQASTAPTSNQNTPQSDVSTNSVQNDATPNVAISSSGSLIIPSDGHDEYIVMRSDTDEVFAYTPPLSDEEVYEYADDDDEVLGYLESGDKVVVLPDGEIITVKKDTSRFAAYRWSTFGLNKDYENKKGFVVYADAGYKWVFLRKMGFNVGGLSARRNQTISGGAASIGFGYSFGKDIPIALEIDFGIGPNLEFNTKKHFGSRFIDSKQKLTIYNFDASIDYDIKTSGLITPFIGINTGLALIGDRGRMKVYDGGSTTATAWGEYKWKRRVNLMGGLRLGAKVQVHENITVSAVAEYNYMGDIQPQQFVLSDGTNASTKRIKAHEFNLKLGARMQF